MNNTRKKRMFCKLYLILFLIVFCGISPSVSNVAAASVGQDLFQCEMMIDREAFWGNNNNKVPVQVTVQNQGEDFSGILELRVITSDVLEVYSEFQELNWLGLNGNFREDNRDISYRKEVDIKSGETGTENFEILFPQNGGAYQIRLLDGNKVVWEESKKLEGGFYWPLQAVVVSDQEDLLAEKKMDKVGESEIQYRVVKPEELQKDWFEKNLAHILVLQSCEKTDLDREMQDSIWRWEENGGKVLKIPDPEMIESELKAVVRESNGAIYRDAYRESDAFDVLERTPVRRQTDVMVYFFLLVIYAIIVGPVLYYVLKRKQKSYHLWLSMCATSLLFLVIIGAFGIKTRVKAPFISYVEQISQSDSNLERQIYFSVQAPFAEDYSMYVDPSYELSPAQTGMNLECVQEEWKKNKCARVEIQYGEQKNRLGFSNTQTYGEQYFSLYRNEKLQSGKMSGEVQVFQDEVSGIVRNESNIALEHAVLFMPNSFIYIGYLPAQSEVNLNNFPVYSFDSMDTEWIRKIIPVEEDRKKQEIIDLWYWKVWNQKDIRYRSQSMVLGIVEEPETSFQMNSGYETNGISLYSFGVKLDNTKDGKLYCPYAFAERSVVGEDYWDNKPSFHYMMTEMVEYQYRLNRVLEEEEEHAKFEPDHIVIRKKEDKGNALVKNFDGMIEVYNYMTQTYDRKSKGVVVLEGEELKQYLSPDNVLQVRYSGNENYTEGVILPEIIAIGSVVD